ncbi:MAG TPA: class I SAM-dependent methyltransferase [Bacteroidota bacterium]|nr:class I SAM-dependent methyltransferase [Bacteroidota bacterium]
MQGAPENLSGGRRHWDGIYAARNLCALSWHQEHASVSMELITHAGILQTDPILDAGGGASPLAGDLLDAGFSSITVCDISAGAIETARQRLGSRESAVRWVVADILTAQFACGAFALWHDRALFHFLQDPAERERYRAQVRNAVRAGGSVIIATFSEAGPDRCSGLGVRRYSAASLEEEFRDGFRPAGSLLEEHRTPSGTVQQFLYVHFRRTDSPG